MTVWGVFSKARLKVKIFNLGPVLQGAVKKSKVLTFGWSFFNIVVTLWDQNLSFLKSKVTFWSRLFKLQDQAHVHFQKPKPQNIKKSSFFATPFHFSRSS